MSDDERIDTKLATGCPGRRSLGARGRSVVETKAAAWLPPLARTDRARSAGNGNDDEYRSCLAECRSRTRSRGHTRRLGHRQRVLRSSAAVPHGCLLTRPIALVLLLRVLVPALDATGATGLPPAVALLAWLGAAGPGPLSLDGFLGRGLAWSAFGPAKPNRRRIAVKRLSLASSPADPGLRPFAFRLGLREHDGVPAGRMPHADRPSSVSAKRKSAAMLLMSERVLAVARPVRIGGRRQLHHR
jgi:hypothetical protein